MIILQTTRGALASAQLDADALAYISTITAVGATVSISQRQAINSFVKTGKAAGWYSNLKRLYLPIWSAASPNAIDIIGRSSGTFSGTVTHASGYVQADGSTGYFDLGATVTGLGLTTSSGYLFSLVTQASTLGFRSLIGRAVGNSNVVSLLSSNASQLFRYNTNLTQVTGSSAGTGIISASREGGNRSIYRRITSSRSTLVSTAGADAGALPLGGNIVALALNTNGGTGFTAGEFNNARCGAYGVGLGFNDTQDSSFSSALKTLWETCTGLTLP